MGQGIFVEPDTVDSGAEDEFFQFPALLRIDGKDDLPGCDDVGIGLAADAQAGQLVAAERIAFE